MIKKLEKWLKCGIINKIMLYDLGLQTEEQIKNHKEELDRRFNPFNPNYYNSGGCVGSRVCEKCKHLISDSICLCVGVFVCPSCGFKNGGEIDEMMKKARNMNSKFVTLPVKSDRELINELIQRVEKKLEQDPKWVLFDKLRTLLFDAGKIIAEWDGRGKN